MKTDTKELACISKYAAESTASVDDDKAAHANFQKDLLKQKAGKFMSVDVVDRHADDELGEVTHSGEQVRGTGFGDSRAGTPKVAVQDEHRSCDGPAEKDFAVATDALVSEDAVGAFLDPVDDVLATARPKETHANPKERLVNAKVTTDRAAMEDVEDEAAQRRGYDDEQERSAGLQTLSNDKAAVVDAKIIVACKLLKSRVEFGDKGGAPSETGGEVAEEGIGDRVHSVS
jgi:hypothetical protein